MGCEDVIKTFFGMISIIKLYHWQTYVHARHEASNDLHSKLLDLSDKFIETYMGKYSRPSFKKSFKITISELTDDEAVGLLRDFSNYLKNELPKHISEKDTDLLNIRDEILGEVNKTLYLFTLK